MSGSEVNVVVTKIPRIGFSGKGWARLNDLGYGLHWRGILVK